MGRVACAFRSPRSAPTVVQPFFWQMHRATIMNLNAVESVGRDLKGHVILRLKDRPELLQVSQPLAHLFRQM